MKKHISTTFKILLTAEKSPWLTIVVGKDAPLPEQFAAQELCRYVQRISGAELPIRTDMEKTEGPRILIGNPNTNRSTAQAFESAHIHFGALDLGEEGFVVQVKKLIKIGNTSLPLEKESDLSKIDQKQGGTDAT